VTLRGKLLLAESPLAIALLAVGACAVLVLSALGARTQLILQDNYRSVLAAQRMKEAIERLDSAALFLVAKERSRADAQIKQNRALFEKELKVQQANVTEEGEDQATSHLTGVWKVYLLKLDHLLGVSGHQQLKAEYFGELEPAFQSVKDAADKILTLNQDAMLDKSRAAERLAGYANTALILTTLGALLAGIILSVSLTNRLLRPLSVLSQAVARLGAGDFAARARVAGQDEIGRLAAQFNAMAQRLSEYRSSSLGELLLAQRASQAAIDSIPDPVIVFAEDGAVLNVNDAAESLLRGGHVELGDLLNSATPELRAQLDAARTHVLQGKGPYLPTGFEDAFAVLIGGVDRWFLLRASPVYEDNGHITGATVILQDVTKLRRFDELKNDLVATVAHEFRTPLTSLRMAIHLCVEGTAGVLNDKQADLLYTARDDCERLQRTVDELLDLARIQSGRIMLRVRPILAGELVQTALGAFRGAAAEKGIDLQAHVGSGLDWVNADPERTQLVFSNLLSNAIRHTPAGASVSMHVLENRSQVRFEVVDSGEGIPPEYQAAVFERFFRVPGSEPGAAGLGLPLAKKIVEAHHGQIGVDSTAGQGSTFWFTLPVAQAKGMS